MKTLIALVIGLAFIGSAFGAENFSPSVSFTPVSFRSVLLSKNVDDDGTLLYDRAVLQSEITISHGNGLYLDVWHSGQANMGSGTGTELQTSIGWSRDVGISVDVGIGYDDYATLFKGPKNDLYVAYAEVSKAYEYDTYGILTPSLELYHYKAGKGTEYEGGFRARLSLEFSHRILASNLTVKSSLIRDDGTFGSIPAWVTSHTLSLDWKAGRGVFKFPTLIAYLPVNSNTGRDPRFVVGMGFAREF